MSRLAPAIELGSYNQGELGVYGRPPNKYNEDTDNVYKVFINKGRHQDGYFDRFDTIDELMEIMSSNYPSALLDLRRPDTREHHDRKLEFLEDTLCFLLTGRRKISLEQWMILIDTDESYMSEYERKSLLDRVDNMRAEITRSKYAQMGHSAMATYISMWCEKPDGVRDMAYSLYFYSLHPLRTDT